jgi:hypothetical protein
MSDKIMPSALEKMQGKRPDELVTLTFQTSTVLVEELESLASWGGSLLYDNGMTTMVRIPVGRVNDIAEWPIVYSIR